MKKFFAMVVSALFAVLVVTGCSKTEDAKAEAPKPDTKAEAQAEEKPAEPIAEKPAAPPVAEEKKEDKGW